MGYLVYTSTPPGNVCYRLLVRVNTPLFASGDWIPAGSDNIQEREWSEFIGRRVDVSMQFSGNEKSKLNPVKPQIASLWPPFSPTTHSQPHTKFLLPRTF